MKLWTASHLDARSSWSAVFCVCAAGNYIYTHIKDSSVPNQASSSETTWQEALHALKALTCGWSRFSVVLRSIPPGSDCLCSKWRAACSGRTRPDTRRRTRWRDPGNAGWECPGVRKHVAWTHTALDSVSPTNIKNQTKKHTGRQFYPSAEWLWTSMTSRELKYVTNRYGSLYAVEKHRIWSWCDKVCVISE